MKSFRCNCLSEVLKLYKAAVKIQKVFRGWIFRKKMQHELVNLSNISNDLLLTWEEYKRKRSAM